MNLNLRPIFAICSFYSALYLFCLYFKENNTIKVIEKGNKSRTISFGNNLAALLWQCVEDREKYFPDIPWPRPMW